MSDDRAPAPAPAPILVSGAGLAALALLPFQRPNLYALVYSRLHPEATPYELGKLLRITLGDLALAAALSLLVVWVIRSGQWRRLVALPAAVWAYLAVIVVAGLAAGAVKSTIKELVQSVELFAAAYVVFACVLGSRRKRASAAVILLEVTALMALVALVQYLAGAPGHLVRAGFLDNNNLGVYMALVLPLALGAGLAEERPWAQSSLLGLAAAGLLVTLSGGLLIAAVAGLVAAAALWSRKALAATAAAAAVVVLLVIPQMPGGLRGRFGALRVFASSGGQTVVTTRFRRWGAAVKLVRGNPFLGKGPGRFTAALAEYYGSGPAEKPAGNTADPAAWNVTADEPGSFGMYNVTACETGLLGLGILMWVFAAAMGAGARALGTVTRNGGRDRGLLCGAMGGVTGVLVAGIFGSPLVGGIWPVMVFMLALIGAIAADAEPRGADAPMPTSADGE